MQMDVVKCYQPKPGQRFVCQAEILLKSPALLRVSEEWEQEGQTRRRTAAEIYGADVAKVRVTCLRNKDGEAYVVGPLEMSFREKRAIAERLLAHLAEMRPLQAAS